MTLFDNSMDTELWMQTLAPGAVVLRDFALREEPALLKALDSVIASAPLRHMVTPGGYRMSVAMTNCGALGWITDKTGYRYDAVDPESHRTWPAMPDCFLRLATTSAAEAGFADFLPDACLINRYEPGAKLSLHQDKDERDFSQPIVSLSLGLPATFLLGGMERADKTTRIHVAHGDVVVWGGPARLRYHGVLPLKEALHPKVGGYRFNLTLRKAG